MGLSNLGYSAKLLRNAGFVFLQVNERNVTYEIGFSKIWQGGSSWELEEAENTIDQRLLASGEEN